MQLADADVIDGARAEFAEKLLGAQRAQILDDKRPQVEHVVARQSIAFLHDHLVKKKITNYTYTGSVAKFSQNCNKTKTNISNVL